ncbi:class I SAM-dependent methyltransferase [Jiangella endophytica]|uniref:class I SAM-dependent methyltransferase n=1 Tax=Jiangella endophytica TaxID=1623398 RepID=UPI0038CC0814
MAASWEWDESLYAGSAPHYAVGRMPYPPSLARAIGDALGSDGSGRLLDVGCGPGSLTLLVSPLFESAVGVDADAGMLVEARRQAARAGIDNVEWRQLRAEDLPADLGRFDVVTFAQSFHWMDQEAVARQVRAMLRPDGVWVHVSATTHRGAAGPDPSPHPQPPWDRIDELVAAYLGPVRRAGRGILPAGTSSGEDEVMRRAGFTASARLDLERGEIVDRPLDDVVAAVFSLSSSAPHLFGDRLGAFEADLRRLLRSSSPGGRFSERARDIGVTMWRP